MTQLHAFFLCAAFGIAGGFLYECLAAIGRLFHRPAVFAGAEIVFCLLFAAGYVLFSLWTALPPFRIYHALGCAAGLILYRKSCHKIVALSGKMVYNGYVRRKDRKRKDHVKEKRKHFRGQGA